MRAKFDAGLSVTVLHRDFDDEDAALDYAIRNQRDRRNMTDAELLQAVMASDRRRQRGGDRRSEEAKSKAPCDAFDSSQKSAQTTAEVVGTSTRKVEKIRAITDYAEATGDREELDAVLGGQMSINAAH